MCIPISAHSSPRDGYQLPDLVRLLAGRHHQQRDDVQDGVELAQRLAARWRCRETWCGVLVRRAWHAAVQDGQDGVELAQRLAAEGSAWARTARGLGVRRQCAGRRSLTQRLAARQGWGDRETAGCGEVCCAGQRAAVAAPFQTDRSPMVGCVSRAHVLAPPPTQPQTGGQSQSTGALH